MIHVIHSVIPYILLILFAAGCGIPSSRHDLPMAEGGVLDLTGFEFSPGKTLPLDGEWEFYWKRLLRSADFGTKPWPEKSGLIRVPSSWNGRMVEGKPLDGTGYATYRLTINLKKGTGPLYFRILDMRTAYTLFVNGEKLAANGTVGTSRETSRPRYLPLIANVTPRNGTLELLLHVSNFHHTKGGAFHSIHIGSKNDIHGMRDMSFAFQIFMLGSLLIMALYHMGMYLIRRDDPTPLYLGLFCLIISIRPLVSGEYLLMGLAPKANWNIILKTEYLTLYLGLPVFAMFMNSLFPGEFPGAVLRFILITGAIFSTIVVASPPHVYTQTIEAYEIITLIASVFTVYAVILAYIRKREGANVFLFGTIVLFITVVNEILYDNMMVNTGNFFPFGLFVFVLSQAFLLSLRFSKAFDNIESLSGELDMKNRQLLRVDRIKDEFLANTSHELRTPLTAIIGIAESLLDGAAGTLPERADANLSMIVSSGLRLNSLINDLLDFSRLKNSDITLKLKPVDIRILTDMAIRLTEHLKGNRDIDIVTTVPRDIPLISADEDRVQQVLINLLGNAIKFTESGRIEVSARVRPGKDSDSSILEVSVSDTGIGIPADRLPFIFEPFEQADGSISRIYGGTGIGLSISRALVRLHGGEMDVESEPGRGSAFHFTIPISHSREAMAGPGAKPLPQMEGRDRARTNDGALFCLPSSDGGADMPLVLVIDDDPITLQIVANQLSLHNYIVQTASSGTEALSRIDGGLSPDLVILDVMMPKMSGLDVLRHLRSRHSLADLPVILLTAKGDASDITTGMEAGANDYLAKPFNRAELLARVNTLMRLKSAVAENRKLSGLRKEFELAKKIQLSTLPGMLPVLPGMDIQAAYIPMESIGGDFYDFHVVDDQRVGVLIADVTGHGVPAALIASMLKIVFYILKDFSHLPDQLLTRMNTILTGNIQNQFATAGYVFIDRAAMKLYYSRCGHEPLIIFGKKKGTIRELTPEGRLIGFTRDNKCSLIEAEIEPGDRILLYTDGIIEACDVNHRMFGHDSMYRVIRETGGLSAAGMLKNLTGQVQDWHGVDEQFEDDMTLVVIDIL